MIKLYGDPHPTREPRSNKVVPAEEFHQAQQQTPSNLSHDEICLLQEEKDLMHYFMDRNRQTLFQLRKMLVLKGFSWPF